MQWTELRLQDLTFGFVRHQRWSYLVALVTLAFELGNLPAQGLQLAVLLAEKPNPVVYAGDCLSIMGVAGGLQRRGIEPTIVFFDAHGDFHTWETTPSDFLGGMPLAMLTGRGEQTIVDGVDMTPIEDDRVWLVDGRDLDPGEDRAVAESGIHHATVDQIAADPPPGDIYLHIDVDVVDPTDMPGVTAPHLGAHRLKPSLGRLKRSTRPAAWSPSHSVPGTRRSKVPTWLRRLPTASPHHFFD